MFSLLNFTLCGSVGYKWNFEAIIVIRFGFWRNIPAICVPDKYKDYSRISTYAQTHDTNLGRWIHDHVIASSSHPEEYPVYFYALV